MPRQTPKKRLTRCDDCGQQKYGVEKVYERLGTGKCCTDCMLNRAVEKAKVRLDG